MKVLKRMKVLKSASIVLILVMASFTLVSCTKVKMCKGQDIISVYEFQVKQYQSLGYTTKCTTVTKKGPK